MNIGIQGIEGSYHHQVVSNIYGDEASIEACANFSDLPPLLFQKKVDFVVMAIENSIAGAILPNYALIDEYNLHILSEYYLPIQHQLMALENQTFKDIKEVWSHPMALEQCRKFFRYYPHIKLIEEKDTALVAQMISEQNLQGIAAIASKKAAEIYNLSILASDIQTHAFNYTRFVILSDEKKEVQGTYDKASIKFTLSHEMGSLAHILTLFSEYHVNLTKIQSLPIIEKPWEYAFFTDVVFENPKDFDRVMAAIKTQVHELKILGTYKHKNSNRI